MGDDAGKTVCWHGVEVIVNDKGEWMHKQSKTTCDDPHPFATPK